MRKFFGEAKASVLAAYNTRRDAARVAKSARQGPYGEPPPRGFIAHLLSGGASCGGGFPPDLENDNDDGDDDMGGGVKMQECDSDGKKRVSPSSAPASACETPLSRTVDIAALRSACVHGITEADRPLAWRVLLGLFDGVGVDPGRFDEASAARLGEYETLARDLITDERLSGVASNFTSELSVLPPRAGAAPGDGVDILNTIHNDVRRTHAHLASMSDAHYAAMQRVLYLYALTNPAVGYVQGMNEILAPLFFLFSQEKGCSMGQAEADAFFCFGAVMSGCVDHFTEALDEDHIGIVGSMRRCDETIARCDPDLHANFRRERVEPQFYAFRWLSLMLAKEFVLPDLMRVWDAVFAHTAGPARERFVRCMAVSMLTDPAVRGTLVSGDLPEILTLLHAYPVHDVDRLVARALLYVPVDASISDHGARQNNNDEVERATPPSSSKTAAATKQQPQAIIINNNDSSNSASSSSSSSSSSTSPGSTTATEVQAAATAGGNASSQVGETPGLETNGPLPPMPPLSQS